MHTGDQRYIFEQLEIGGGRIVALLTSLLIMTPLKSGSLVCMFSNRHGEYVKR